MKILITGAAGFIGYHLANELMSKSNFLIGFDNLNSYYNKNLKLDRLKELDLKAKSSIYSWEFIKGDLIDTELLDKIFKN